MVDLGRGFILGLLVCALGAGPAYAQPLGRWALDEGSGQIARDATGRGHDGLLGETGQADAHDPAWIPGRFGTALRFDANRDLFVSVRNPSSLVPARVTVEAWVRRLGSPGRWRYVLSSGANQCVSASYGLYSGFNGGLAFYVSDEAGYVLSPQAAPETVWDGSWRRVSGTYDGQRVRLYVDGVEVADGTPATFAIARRLAGTSVFIGTYRGSCSRPFTGDIDEVSVHDRALTPGEIAADAEEAAAMPTPPQKAPLSGPPAPAAGGEGERPVSAGCLRVTVTPRRIRIKRRTRVVVTVRRGRRPAAGRKLKVRGAGVRRTVKTGSRGRAKFVVRASRRGRLSLKPLGLAHRCVPKYVNIIR